MTGRTQTQEPSIPRRWLIIGLCIFSALSAIGGGIELIVWPNGNQYLPPPDILLHTPFTDYWIPGLILAVVVGGTSAGCIVFVWKRSSMAVDSTILAGGTLFVWILAETAMLRGLHWLHFVYGALGAAIFGLGLNAIRHSSSFRHRWIVRVTLAESLGFMAPVSVGIWAHSIALSESQRAGVIVIAGLIEGMFLGLGQAWAFPLSIKKLRYVWLTSVGAGVVWASVMLGMLLVSEENGVMAALVGLLLAPIGLFSIGGAQWLELRRHTSRARSWILWTALAWTLALPLSFSPGPFVDESTPLIVHLVLWGSAGLLMAYVMSLVTWQGVRRLPAVRGLGSWLVIVVFSSGSFFFSACGGSKVKPTSDTPSKVSEGQVAKQNSETPLATRATEKGSEHPDSLEIASSLTLSGRPGALALSDLNGDEKLDAIVTIHGQQPKLFFGDGKGTLREQPRAIQKELGHPTAIAIADFQKDGFQDIAVVEHESNNLELFWGGASGSFDPKAYSSLSVHGEPHLHTVAVADLNQDGWLDLLTDSWGNNQFFRHLGGPKGFSTNQGKVSVFPQPRSNLEAGDLNGDGWVDVVAPAATSSGVSVLFGPRVGEPGAAEVQLVPTPPSPFFVLLVDLDSDAQLDILVLHRSGSTSDQKNDKISWLRNSGGSFQLQAIPGMKVGASPTAACVGRNKGEGRPVVAIANYADGTVSLIRGGPQPIPLPSQNLGGSPIHIACGDVNGDGRMEFLVALEGDNRVALRSAESSKH